ncbi:MAG: hypothetical protein AAF844_14155 [Pseudomonadota bacterium]
MKWTGKTGAKTPWFVAAETNRAGLVFAGLWAEAAIAGEKIRASRS